MTREQDEANNKGVTMQKRPRYSVKSDEGNAFFPTAEKFLEFLRDNDECECGCEMLSEAQEKAIDAAGPDDYVDYKSIK